MDFKEFFTIVEGDKDLLNPISHEKLMLLAEYCDIRDGSRVLDLGSGKGYMLRKWANHWEIEGIGLDIIPAFVSDALERADSENVSDRLTFIEGDAREFSGEPHSFDVVTCIGASFAIGTSNEATDWMLRYLKPGGTLALGDVFLKSEPPEGLASVETTGPLRTLIENHDALEERGIGVTGIISASEDDWDRYCCSGWKTSHEWSLENPEHEHRDEVLNAMRNSRREYLSFQKEYVGWAILTGRFAGDG